MTANPPLLEVLDLSISFTQYDRGLHRRTVRPVEAMSASVAAGEVVALVGASGAGKSLLAHAVLGMLPPNAATTGEVRWRGTPVDEPARRRLAGREVALLPQSLTYLDPTATVGSQVRRAARLAGHPRSAVRSRAEEALAAQGLDRTVLRRHPHELSGGMGRRVLTAIALMGEPSLVIADEPTPGLAAEGVRTVLGRLRGLADSGRGVLLVTHDLAAALEVADRVVVCDRGRTVDEVPAEAFADGGGGLTHPYTRALWRALPDQSFAVPELEPVASC